MLKIRKFTCVLLTLAMLLSCFVNVAFAAKVSKISGDKFDIEAESNAVDILGGLNSVDDEGIVNEGGMSVKPNDGEKGDIYFQFKTDSTDTYEIWALVSPLSETKSMYVSIDDTPYTSITLQPAKGIYLYTKLGEISDNANKTTDVSISANNGWYTIDKFTIIKSGTELKNPDGTIAGSNDAVEKYLAEKEASKVYAKDIPTFNVSGDGKLLSMNELGLSQWWSDKNLDGVDCKYVTEGRSSTPANDARGDIEFDFIPDASAAYCVWAYTYPTSISKTTWININGSYSTVPLANAEKTWQWIRLGVYDAQPGSKVSVKMIPKLSTYGMAYIYIVKGKDLVPDGTDGKISKKEFDTSVVYPKPTLTPQKGMHPRVMFTADDIPQIKENMAYEGNAAALERYNINLASDTDGTLPKVAENVKSNFNGEILNIIQSRAFEYAINDNEEMGKSAVSSLRNYVKSVVFDYGNDQSYNYFGEAEYVIGCVYDWCYKLLSDSDKELFRDAAIEYASNKIGYPPIKLGSVTSHGTEGPLLRDLLSFSIASYDEYPSIYENVAGRLYSEYVPAKNFLYNAHMGAMQGGYTNYREKWAGYTLYLMNTIGEKNIFGENQQYVPYWFMYARRPDGAVLNDGDSGQCNNEYYHSYYSYPDLLLLLSNYYENPYMKWEYLRQQEETIPAFETNQSINCTTMFICNKKIETKPVSELPLSHYFAEPKGSYIARTSWDEGYNSPAVVCDFKINEYWTSNHQHLDAGAFQIYYKGYLAADSGYYGAVKTEDAGGSGYGKEHWKNFYTKTIAHNCMLVYDPNEELPKNYSVNDGGQQMKNNRSECANLDTLLSETADMKVGEILGHESGLDTYAPNYTYLKGDITNAYSDKVSEYQRSFMFLNLKNDKQPAALVVFDHIVTSDASFKKSFALNTVAEPQTKGSRLVVTDSREFDEANHYNGKMTVDTLIPSADNITYTKYVGDEKYSYSGDIKTYAIAPKDTDGQGTRTEISPKTAATEDYFLNVIQVGDADGEQAPAVTLIESSTHAGAVISDRVVMMGKAKDRVSDNVSFNVANEGSFEFTVADLAAGTWNVSCNGTQVAQAKVTKEGGVATFTGTNGSYALSYASSDADKQFIQSAYIAPEYIGIRINGHFLYSDVAPFIENDRTLVPLRAIFEGVGASVGYDDATATATGTKGNTTIQITEGSITAYVNGNAVTLDVPAKTYSDRFMVPIRFIAENLGCSVDWNNEAQIVDINADIALVVNTRDKVYDNEITIISAKASGDDGNNPIENTLDGAIGTRWSVAGDDGEKAWGIYDLGQVYSLDKVCIAFHSGNTRSTTFAVDVSEDGVNYTNVIEKASSSGSSINLEEFELGGAKGQYVKFRGYGNSANEWNSITEFVVTEKK